MKKLLQRKTAFQRKQKEARRTGARYYGDGGTIHGSGFVHVEVCDGEVVAVWFRCQQLPFQAVEVSKARGTEMRRAFADIRDEVCLVGVEVVD